MFPANPPFPSWTKRPFQREGSQSSKRISERCVGRAIPLTLQDGRLGVPPGLGGDAVLIIPAETMLKPSAESVRRASQRSESVAGARGDAETDVTGNASSAN